MKHCIVICLLAMVIFSRSRAQFPSTAPNQFQGGFGLTWINNEPFYAFHLRPDLSFGKIGVGLDLNLEFDSQGKLRKENFNEFSDYIAVIRYVRYGTERDTVFLKLGSLDWVTLGQGNIINEYNNSPSFDTRKTGMQFNLNLDKYGVQTLWSNFAQAGVVGVRGFVHPLKLTSIPDIPVISNVEIGATYAADFATAANASAVATSGDGQSYSIIDMANSLTITGFDIDFPVLRSDLTGIDLYANYTKIITYGSGQAIGGMFHFDLSSLVTARARLERRFNGDHYIAGYFDALYEIERVNIITGATKSGLLASMVDNSNGYYGDLLIRLIGTFDILGSYQKLDNVSNSGIFHAYTNVAPEGMPIVARAGYDKVNIVDFTDLVTTDDRSYLYAEVGYKPLPYLITSMLYSWTFTPIRNGSDIVGYEPQRKVEPRVTFVYTFGE
ncbi:MAG: hypothetical protein ACHQQQ_14605 [Bacteroidota bacterium]